MDQQHDQPAQEWKGEDRRAQPEPRDERTGDLLAQEAARLADEQRQIMAHAADTPFLEEIERRGLVPEAQVNAEAAPEAAQQPPALHRIPDEAKRAEFAAKAAALDGVEDWITPEATAAQQAMQKADEADKAPSAAERKAARAAGYAADREAAPTAAERNATTNQRQSEDRKAQERSVERSSTSSREGHRSDTPSAAERKADRAKQYKEAREGAGDRTGRTGGRDDAGGTAARAFAGFGR